MYELTEIELELVSGGVMPGGGYGHKSNKISVKVDIDLKDIGNHNGNGNTVDIGNYNGIIVSLGS